jgi:hypothetical protein
MPTVTPQRDPASTRPVPTPTHPVAGRTVSEETTAFEWTAVPDVDEYRLQLAPSEDFETLHYDETVTPPVPVDLGAVLPADAATVYWRVRPDTEDGHWGAPAHFDVSGTVPKHDSGVVVEADPVPVHPASEAPIDPAAATFAWEDVPEASGYRLQVAPGADFADPLVDLTLDRVTSVVLHDRLPDAERRLHWRVRPLFPNGASGPWSARIEFVTSPIEEQDVAPEGAVPAETEDEDPTPSRQMAAAAGPARHARTSRAMSVAFILLVVLGFLLSVVLTAL